IPPPAPPRLRPPPPDWPVRSSKLSLSGESPKRIGKPSCLTWINAPASLRLQSRPSAATAARKGDSLVMKLQGKTALVTGSTSGIGLAIARAFAFEGASVMINGFGDADEIEGVRQELEASSGAQALYDGADLGDAGAIEAMIRRCGHELTAPDILV